jgi:hypothetical protein
MLRLVAPLLTIAVVVAGVIAIRHATGDGTHPSSAAHLPLPTNPAIEATWGVRFTNAVILADGGVVELRYLVVDSARAARIHTAVNNIDDNGTVTPAAPGNPASLPTIIVENTGLKVAPNSVMFHFHHGPTEVDGRTYSIVYGNAGGAVHNGSMITIRMTDGLVLRHFVVTN